MGTNSYGKVRIAGNRAKKRRNDLISAEEKMALLVGPQAELIRKKRSEELLQVLIGNEDANLQKKLLKKLEDKIMLMNKSSEQLINSIENVQDFSIQSEAETNFASVTDNGKRRVASPPLMDKDELSELKWEVTGQTQNQEPEQQQQQQTDEPVKWILRIVEDIANPISRFREIEYFNKLRRNSKPKEMKSVKLNFSQSAQKDAKDGPVTCQQIPTSSEENSDKQNAKDDEVSLFNANCGKDDGSEMNEEEQWMNMLNLAYELDENIISEVISKIDQTLNRKSAEITSADYQILDEEGLKEEQSTLQMHGENCDVVFDEFMPADPMTPPRPSTPAHYEQQGIPSPKTPSPSPMPSYRSRIKEVVEKREKEGPTRLLDIITLDGDDEA